MITISERLELLKQYFNEDVGIMSDIEGRYDFYIRDIDPFIKGYDVDQMHMSVWDVPRNGFPLNHGFGDLKGLDKQVHGLQFRHYNRPINMTFDYYLRKREAIARGDRTMRVSNNCEIWL